MIAGGDTSATVLRGFLYNILISRRVYHKLKVEIRERLARGNISFPISYSQPKELPDLQVCRMNSRRISSLARNIPDNDLIITPLKQAVSLESFRLALPFTHGHYKSVPPGGDTLNGIFLPRGTAIGHNGIAVTRGEKIFGPDIETFRPERFLECEEPEKQEMERALDILFGGGRWTCAGKMVAVAELSKAFFEVRNFFGYSLPVY